jgi:N-acetylneuraminic acid mutarotase
MGGTGPSENSGYLYSCEAYNILRDEWTNIASMNTNKDVFSAIAINNQFIYTFGGCTPVQAVKPETEIDTIERYDITKNEWQLLDLKLNSRNCWSACFSPEPNKVVIVGGYLWYDKVELIDLKTNKWESLPHMNDSRRNLPS